PTDIDDRMGVRPTPRGRGRHRAPRRGAELAILDDSDVVLIHPELLYAHTMRGLLAFGEGFPCFSPVELLPDALKFLRIAAHEELACRDVDHLRAVDRVDARAVSLALSRVGDERERNDTGGVALTSSQTDHPEQTDPATTRTSRHRVFLWGIPCHQPM